ncbi:hypothetical protein FDP41_009709 [Naegleria fowleri]|uniref:Uncharacterized protein n=1 Tax=Naegleria fowleri TaxID=5763 RepID=A0A6A5AV79_NAEFO|nr:uncharacterized protein FDP41_009709 [Naegleria fowleri]KAF0972013.1 hypothetical protein FDP41_009709 [Naegleria fowleri]
MKHFYDIHKDPMTFKEIQDTEVFMNQFIHYFESYCAIFNEKGDPIVSPLSPSSSLSTEQDLRLCPSSHTLFLLSYCPTNTLEVNMSLGGRIERLSKRISQTSALQNEQIQHFEKLINNKNQ